MIDHGSILFLSPGTQIEYVFSLSSFLLLSLNSFIALFSAGYRAKKPSLSNPFDSCAFVTSFHFHFTSISLSFMVLDFVYFDKATRYTRQRETKKIMRQLEYEFLAS